MATDQPRRPSSTAMARPMPLEAPVTSAMRCCSSIVAFYRTNAQSMLARGLDSTSADLVEKGLRAQPDDAVLLKLKADLAARAAAQGNN